MKQDEALTHRFQMTMPALDWRPRRTGTRVRAHPRYVHRDMEVTFNVPPPRLCPVFDCADVSLARLCRAQLDLRTPVNSNVSDDTAVCASRTLARCRDVMADSRLRRARHHEMNMDSCQICHDEGEPCALLCTGVDFRTGLARSALLDDDGACRFSL